jgi:tRNA U34 5-methylaminomethyl-2-thiouridine-forming methyltransferase MnmC
VHSVLEIGLGTGLNALLTLLEADKCRNRIYYTALEPYPLEAPVTESLNYCGLLNTPEYQKRFEKIHNCPWEEMIEISEYFRLIKMKCRLQDYNSSEVFSLVYYDAFAPNAQPELWTREVFEKLFSMMLPKSVLVTYCSKGDVRRAMLAAGFIVEKLPGPPGKREMLRAVKPQPKV